MNDLFSLAGRSALVTGGSRGIGRMIAAGFLKRRCARRLHLVAQGRGLRSPPRASCRRSAPASRCRPTCPTRRACRRSSPPTRSTSLRSTSSSTTPARPGARSFDSFPEKGWDKVVDLNLKTPFFLTQALAGPLRKAASAERPAKVINIASIDGISVNPQETYSYAASKAGLIQLTRRMALRLAKEHIVVSAIAPGAFASEMNRDARDHADAVKARIPARAASASTTTWPARRSTSPRAPATTSSARPWSSTAA